MSGAFEGMLDKHSMVFGISEPVRRFKPLQEAISAGVCLVGDRPQDEVDIVICKSFVAWPISTPPTRFFDSFHLEPTVAILEDTCSHLLVE
jgi:hypothetical protein